MDCPFPRPVVPEVLMGKGGSVEDTVTVEKVELFLIGCKHRYYTLRKV